MSGTLKEQSSFNLAHEKQSFSSGLSFRQYKEISNCKCPYQARIRPEWAINIQLDEFIKNNNNLLKICLA
jgi:hypothetical protein